MIRKQLQETQEQIKKDIGTASVQLPSYVKKASQDILTAVHQKEQKANPKNDGNFLFAIHYLTVHYFKKIGKASVFIIAFLTCCQILYPKAPLELALAGIFCLAIFSSSLAFSKVFIYRIIRFLANKKNAKSNQAPTKNDE